jgi:hypothetical protein
MTEKTVPVGITVNDIYKIRDLLLDLYREKGIPPHNIENFFDVLRKIELTLSSIETAYAAARSSSSSAQTQETSS